MATGYLRSSVKPPSNLPFSDTFYHQAPAGDGSRIGNVQPGGYLFQIWAARHLLEFNRIMKDSQFGGCAHARKSKKSPRQIRCCGLNSSMCFSRAVIDSRHAISPCASPKATKVSNLLIIPPDFRKLFIDIVTLGVTLPITR